MEPIRPSVWRSAKWNTALSVSAVGLPKRSTRAAHLRDLVARTGPVASGTSAA